MTNSECIQWWIRLKYTCGYFFLFIVDAVAVVEANNFIYKQLKVETHNFIFDSLNMLNVYWTQVKKIECLFCYLCHQNKDSVHCMYTTN